MSPFSLAFFEFDSNESSVAVSPLVFLAPDFFE